MIYYLINSNKVNYYLLKYSLSLSRYSEIYLHVYDNNNNYNNYNNNSSSSSSNLNNYNNYNNYNNNSYNTSNYNYLNLIIVYLILFSDCLSISSSFILFYNYFQSNYSLIGITLLYTLQSIFILLSTLFTSYIIDRKGPKIPLLYGSLLYFLSLILNITCFNFQENKDYGYGILIISQCIHGIASPLIYGSSLSFLTMSHSNEIRPYVVNFMMIFSMLGLILGPLISSILYSSYNSLSVYIPSLIISFISIILFLTIYNNGHSILINDMTDEDAEMAIGLLSISSSTSTTLSSSISRSGSAAAATTATASSSTKYAPLIQHSLYEKQRINNFYTFINIFFNKYNLITFTFNILLSFVISFILLSTPNYLHEQFHLNLTQQGTFLSLLFLFVACLAIFYSKFHSILEYKTITTYLYHIYASFLLIGVLLCLIMFIQNIYLIIFLWFLIIGISFVLISVSLLLIFGEIAEWNSYEDFSTALFMSQFSTNIGFIFGPIIGSFLQLSFSGGLQGFNQTCLLLGIICIVFSFFVLQLRSVGKRLGEDSLELEGSLYGHKSLDTIHDSSYFTNSQNMSLSPRNLFESSFQSKLLNQNEINFQDDSVVF